MKYKTEKLVERFASLLSQWPEVECIVLNEAAEPDTLDPYFAVILDVYYNGTIPGSAKRKEMYGPDIAAFESSGGGNKDRFLAENLPVRLEFKDTKKTEELTAIIESRKGDLWLLKDSGTYGYYRLAQGELLFSRTGWIKQIRSKLLSLNDEFWLLMRDAVQSKMEHSLSDLGAALFNDDEFHYLISSAFFIKYACLNLFCINRHFEPSHRAYYKQVLEMPVLPESFAAELETFLREGETRERKYNIAQLIGRKIIAL
ncbi:MAG: DUF4037 domain-containing protein [Spirochaetaceae bacterium]|jgi:hypothetical protein|nr:DUF4037 domain-containing protein [Spirochaetaceae bacterium]